MGRGQGLDSRCQELPLLYVLPDVLPVKTLNHLGWAPGVERTATVGGHGPGRGSGVVRPGKDKRGSLRPRPKRWLADLWASFGEPVGGTSWVGRPAPGPSPSCTETRLSSRAEVWDFLIYKHGAKCIESLAESAPQALAGFGFSYFESGLFRRFSRWI